jgi:hypothetical protein
MKKISVFIVLLIISINLFAQKFNSDGSMKLTEVSTDKSYGMESDAKNSIKVGTISNEYAYIAALLGPNGEKIQARRVGSCCPFESKNSPFGQGLLDKWEIRYEGLDKPIYIYLNGYDYETPKCPMGLTSKGVSLPNNSNENDLKFEPCENQNLYAVNNVLTNQQLANLPQPDNSPEFGGGLEELKKFFADKKITDKKAKKTTFKVSIAFLVNCKGQAGNFLVVSEGQGNLNEYANQVLEITKKMPQNWLAAKKADNKIDCYQVLDFTIVKGQLNQVTYK